MQIFVSTALFWNEKADIQYERALRTLAQAKSLDSFETARLNGMVHGCVADASLEGFHTEYFYMLWRPFPSIPRADTDGNSETASDQLWTPLLNVNHPEYPSAHAFFTLRRRARFGASKPKTGQGFPLGRPNRPTRPSLSRTGTQKNRLKIFQCPNPLNGLGASRPNVFRTARRTEWEVGSSSLASWGRDVIAKVTESTGFANANCASRPNKRGTDVMDNVIWWDLARPMRQTAEFRRLVGAVGLEQLWRVRGLPDKCRPKGDGDLVCD